MKVQEVSSNEIIISNNVAYLKGANAAVTFTNKIFFEEPVESILLPSKSKKQRGVAPWGADNDLPDRIVTIVGKNPIGSRCLVFRIDVAYGNGPKFGHNVDGEFTEYSDKEIASSVELQEIEAFFNDNDIEGMYSELITDIEWFYNGFDELILDRNDPAKRKIISLAAKEAYFSRWESADPKTGLVENHFYSTKWAEGPQENEYEVTPVLWTKNPGKELEIKIGRTKNLKGEKKDDGKYRYILPVRMPSPGRKYYPKPYYYSIIESGWMDFANAIPTFKKALMQNSITIAYHIEIHEDYFKKVFKKEGITDKKKMDARVKKEYDELNKFLKGADNAGKAMITYFKTTPDGKEIIPDIKITVVDKKMDGKFIEDSQEASSMTFIAFGVHPQQLGPIPGQTVSNLSGTDKRELYTINQALQARLKSRLLRALYLVKQINKWPEELKFAIPSIIINTTDKKDQIEEVNM